MADPTELALVRRALTAGLGGCVEWYVNVVERIEPELARHGLTLAAVQRQLIQFVRSGGEIVQISEKREHWKLQREYWYKAVLPLPNLFPKGLFVELVLVDSDPDVPEVELVNAHEQL